MRLRLIWSFSNLNVFGISLLGHYLGEAEFCWQDRFHKFNPFWQLQGWHCETNTNCQQSLTTIIQFHCCKHSQLSIQHCSVFHNSTAFCYIHLRFNCFEPERKKKCLEGVYGNTEQSRIFRNLEGFPRNTWKRFKCLLLTLEFKQE